MFPFPIIYRPPIGLSDLAISNCRFIGNYANSYASSTSNYQYLLAKGYQPFERYRDVFGCGLVLDPDNKLVIFFTLNGQLWGKFISDLQLAYQHSVRESGKY
jgi:hypothetical protein